MIGLLWAFVCVLAIAVFGGGRQHEAPVPKGAEMASVRDAISALQGREAALEHALRAADPAPGPAE